MRHDDATFTLAFSDTGLTQYNGATTSVGSKGWVITTDYRGRRLETWGDLTLFERRCAEARLTPDGEAAWQEVQREIDRVRRRWPFGTNLYALWKVCEYWWFFDAPLWLTSAPWPWTLNHERRTP